MCNTLGQLYLSLWPHGNECLITGTANTKHHFKYSHSLVTVITADLFLTQQLSGVINSS
jgi:hypothetical protein